MPNFTNMNSKVTYYSNAVQSSQQPIAEVIVTVRGGPSYRTRRPKQPHADAEKNTTRGKSNRIRRAKQPNTEAKVTACGD